MSEPIQLWTWQHKDFDINNTASDCKQTGYYKSKPPIQSPYEMLYEEFGNILWWSTEYTVWTEEQDIHPRVPWTAKIDKGKILICFDGRTWARLVGGNYESIGSTEKLLNKFRCDVSRPKCNVITRSPLKEINVKAELVEGHSTSTFQQIRSTRK